MKFRYFWNALLITIGLVLTALSMPQIIAQAQAAVRHDWDLGSATWLANLTGNLFAILLALGSLGSGTWRAVGRTTWW